MKRKTLSDLFEEYKIKHNGNPKHDFPYFIKTISQITFHREHIRPQIIWWNTIYL
jgi:hypothetical protein